jgi:hypothetical protein
MDYENNLLGRLAMERRHEELLMQRVEEVAWYGVAKIMKWELKAWYKKERLAKTVWRDIKERFDAIDGQGWDLFCYETDESLILIHEDNLKRLSEKMKEDE